MAEAAALALAAMITQRLSLQGVNFLSDNDQLVRFLNALDQTHPLDWRIKHFTQVFSNHTAQAGARILKIQRSENHTADVLARQALSICTTASTLACVSSYIAHASQCPLSMALQSVTLKYVRLLSAYCC